MARIERFHPSIGYIRFTGFFDDRSSLKLLRKVVLATQDMTFFVMDYSLAFLVEMTALLTPTRAEGLTSAPGTVIINAEHFALAQNYANHLRTEHLILRDVALPFELERVARYARILSGQTICSAQFDTLAILQAGVVNHHPAAHQNPQLVTSLLVNTFSPTPLVLPVPQAASTVAKPEPPAQLRLDL